MSLNFKPSVLNFISRIGACGFVPLINSYIKILSIYLIKIDDNMVPIRDKNGFCIECKRGEKGLLIGMIGNTAKVIFSNLEWFLFKKMYFETIFL